MKTKAYLAEGLGAFLLTFGVCGSEVIGFGIGTPIIAALILSLCVYTLGGVSGSHLNPAITLMLYLQKNIKAKDAAFYIIAQVLGAGVAGFFALNFYGSAPNPTLLNGGTIFLAEVLGTFCLGLGVSAAANKQVSQGASGITVGGSLLLGILLSFKVSNGVLNPAVAVGIGSLSALYVAGPILGAALAGLAYSFLISKK